MRDLILLAVICGSLPVIVFRPFYGLLIYTWMAFMRPQDMAWGITKVLPLSQWIAIAMVIGLVLTLGKERLATIKIQTVLLFLLWVWISFSVLTALEPGLSKHIYGLYWKAILISIFITGLVSDRYRLRLLTLLIAFSIGFLGAKYGVYGLLRGGARFHSGPGGFMSDNNTFALALNMVLPLLIGIALVEKQKILRYTAIGMAVLSLLTIIFTFSRGGFLTLAVTAPLMIWRSKHRTAVIAVLAVVFCVLFYSSSGAFKEDYLERTASISEYQADGSARGRLNAWETSWLVFLDYPWFGVGPNNFEVVFHQYSPEPDRFRVHHNSYLQILSESGLPALLLFLTALAATLWKLQRLRGDTQLAWAETYARMLQISIIAFCVGGMFLNMAYTELIYALIGLSVALEVVARKEALAGEPAAALEEAAADLPWWKRPAPSPSAASLGGA